LKKSKILNEMINPGVVVRYRKKSTNVIDDYKEGTNEDYLVLEEPLEILVNGELISITMRTPGNDDVLAIGFLFSEGIIKSLKDIKKLEDNCKSGNSCNLLNVYLPINNGKKNSKQIKKLRRGTLTSASCGVCGRQSIDDMLGICEKQKIDSTFPKEIIAQSTEILSDQQINFSHTGGCHGSAILNRNGEVLSSFEDVGRHNAVDKTIGDLIMQGLISRPPSKELIKSQSLLVVSGRLSFDIVQKCAVASIPLICSVSAPSSLAVDLANEVGITIASFVRDRNFSIYTHPDRIQ
tara:strand:+ start:8860 stop:9741 length:882 start_codon:yes stop_codon:yes gene_type:complete